MTWRTEWKAAAAITAVFGILYYYAPQAERLTGPIGEAVGLAAWYAREHVLLCLIPAFFIAGAIAVFLNQATVMKYLGADANKFVSYGVASVSGTILAVCSCTVLPLFAGIYRVGAGLGPAAAFLYAGPAINVLAIILTARVLGVELGVARAVGAILFSLVIGGMMHFLFRREEADRAKTAMVLPESESARPLWHSGWFMATMIAILVAANWADPGTGAGLFDWIGRHKWIITSVAAVLFGLGLVYVIRIKAMSVLGIGLITVLAAFVFPDDPVISFGVAVLLLGIVVGTGGSESREWLYQSWGFAKKMMPLLFYGVLIAGLLLGRPGGEGLIPAEWVAEAVGGNSIRANLLASAAGAFMYFATLTEVPILQGLIANGMGQGPALALLLAGPALSLPNMLVIRSVIGTKKTAVFVTLVIIMATVSGTIYGIVIERI